MNEMVTEYTGVVIRPQLADTRERYYNERGLGCYMFALDDDSIIDATQRGNSARFINHSCEPNCHARYISIDGTRKIVMSAIMDVEKDAELTYDYCFQPETDPSVRRVPCSCGSQLCRQFLN